MPDQELAHYGGGVAAVDVVMTTAELRVSRFTLAPHGVLPWHLHTQITDYFVGITGSVQVETREPVERIDLAPGVEFRVPPRRPHVVRNTGDALATYLIVQGVGPYDRIPAPPPGEE
ncbi:cupin domain-containing protein [Mycobacterium sp. CVI_P3]|uniref:Cupin domain-containing protein n=1 Tax=Mycobacterium pinniadriaticum TaxID=2994102 RepID=A0ABT3SAK0_9MYCO|nr:cupin domain-containing protein [Mycobacterium pinniadriaticum]MCX2929478.1 cupin domain-containing protein [Mycobacterium pinniadriaticum]MCX2935902.1 cupin domain-containing protein [Mycobacterium pinniadriaticum]